MNEQFNLSGKVALVTGATHGLGMAMAKALGKAGATLVVNGNTPEKMTSALEEYKKENLAAHGLLFDVTNEALVKQNVEKIEKEIGPIAILVNNAGMIKRVPALEMEVEDFRKVLDVDLTGPFIMSKQVGKYMVERKAGKIINICSMMSELGRNTVSAYAAAKGGLKMLTRNLATEWAKYNIQVNGIGRVILPQNRLLPSAWAGILFMSLFLTGRRQGDGANRKTWEVRRYFLPVRPVTL